MEISRESPPFMAVTSSATAAEVAASPEFEFWMLGKNPQPSSLLTADELFFDGVLLPLHLLSISHSNTSADSPSTDELNRDPPPPTTTTTSSPSPSRAHTAPTPPPVSRLTKWRDHIPRAGSREKTAAEDGGKEQRRSKERRGSAGGPAELNINIWPFSRSRSAGNAAAAGSWSARARAAVAGRKVSSAPCSRSNSRGESSAKPVTTASPSSSRRWAPSASRVAAFAGGIHLGRTTPVWKIHKKVTAQHADGPGDKASAAPGTKKAAAGDTPAGGVRVLSFHVNTCIGYRNRESCSSGNPPMAGGGGVVGGGESSGSGGVGGGGGGSSSFKLRTIFSKNNNAY